MYADATSTEPLQILCWDVRQDGELTEWVMATGTEKTIRRLKRHAKKHPLPTLEEVKAGKREIEI